MSARTVWNVIGWVLYVAALCLSGAGLMMFSMVFAMSTDACHDSACDASYRVMPAMYTMWGGVAVVLTATLAVMLLQSVRGRIIIGWSIAGALGAAGVFLLAFRILH